jgi:hypothetical protein
MAYDPKGNIFKQLYDAIVALDSVGGGGGGGGNVTVVNPDPIPVSTESLPLPTGAATQNTLASLLTTLNLQAKLTEVQPVSANALPLPAGAATQTTLASLLTELGLKAKLADTQPVSAAALPLPAGAATQATLAALLTELGLKPSNPPAPALTTQTIATLGSGAVIDIVGRTAVSVQLAFGSPSTAQVVRLRRRGVPTAPWEIANALVGGDTFTLSELQAYAAATAQTGISFETLRPRYSGIQVEWVSGTAPGGLTVSVVVA